MVDRRTFLAAAIGSAAVRAVAHAQGGQQQISPVPTPRDWSRLEPIAYPDPDIVALDPRFRQYIVFNTSIKRHHIGTLWAEGPAWNGVGRYLVWSDIPNNVQMRWIEEDGRVTTFRNPSGYSNGNTFDYEGRQLSCEHGGRRVVQIRAERNRDDDCGTLRWQAAQLAQRCCRRILMAASGSPIPSTASAATTRASRREQESKEAVYRVDGKSGQIAKVTDEVGQPNGLCFSPDYKKLYVADTGMPREIKVWDVDGERLRNGKRFVQLDIPGTGAPSAADGIRCDADGNIWAGARPGVQIFAPNGDRIGMIRLPETCAQRLLRRDEAQPSLHDGEPVAL